MTGKMKLILVMTAFMSAPFVVLSAPFAVDIAERMLSAVGNTLGLHEAPKFFALVILVIPGLYLYLAFKQRRRS